VSVLSRHTRNDSGGVEAKLDTPNGTAEVFFFHCNRRQHSVAFGLPVEKRIARRKLSIVACDRRAGNREAWLASFREEERENIHFYALDVTAEEQVDALDRAPLPIAYLMMPRTSPAKRFI
jgi:hypothetical protein